MHSNISECDSELEIPSKKIKLSSTQENCKTREIILSKVLQKEIQQEINLRKDDLELIEANIFLVRQKLTRLKQVLGSEYYRQKSVKGSLQYSYHPAVKDTFIGKSPRGYNNYGPSTSASNHVETLENNVTVKEELELVQEVIKDDSFSTSSSELKKLLECDKLPCYIPPKNTDDNVVKPTEPRGIDSKKEIRIIVGNVSKWLAPLDSSDATHKWTVYAKLAQTDLDISLFVNKVIFFLHKSYRPNDIIEIKSPPFKLTRRGWGEFPLKAQFHFKSPDNPPIDVMHHLKLDHVHIGFETFGAETSLTVWVHYPLQNGILKDKKKNSEKISIKTEDVTKSQPQILTTFNAHQPNIFYNSDAMNDISLNANIEPFENDINSGGFSFPEHSCDSESISSLFDEIKQEELQSFSSLITSYEGKALINQNCIKENYSKEAELNSAVTNKIAEDEINLKETFVNKTFPDINPNEMKAVQVKTEIEQNLSPTHKVNYGEQNILEVKPKIEENFSEIKFNEFDTEVLFLDECAVVAEEVVIDCDESELGDSNNVEVQENKKTILQKSVKTEDHQKTSENHIPSSSFNSIKPDAIISCVASSFDTVKKHGNNNFKTESSLDEIIQQLGIDVDDGNAKSDHRSEADKCSQIKGIEVLSVLQNQESNKITPKNSFDIINGLALSNTRKAQKNTEKKSMIITLQKENGQIILRKEAKVQKFKDSSPKKGVIAIEKKPILINNKSLVNSIPTPIKNSRIIVDIKKQLPPKRSIQLSNITKIVQSSSKFIPIDGNSSLQKKSLPGVSILKKVKNLNKQDRYEDISNHDLARQCPTQNTEIAVNWLMKKFPLVDTRSSIAGFRQKHPYCAKDRDTFLNWPFAKQRAAEWMRAKAIGRILKEIPDLQEWTTLEILDWARVRCYTPIRIIPEYNGPTVEPSLDFVYRPKAEGIVEFLKQEKILTEKEILDVTTSDSPHEKVVSKSGGVDESAGTSQGTSNQNSIVLPLDKEIEGFKSFVNKCMMNVAGERTSHEELLPGVHYPAVDRVFVSVFSSIAEELIRRSYNASWIRHCDNPPPEISIADVKAAILSRKEFDFLLPFSEEKGKEKPSVMSSFRK